MNTLIFYGLVYGLSALPLKATFYKIYQFVRHIFSQMDRPPAIISASAWQFLIGFVWIFEFVRGFALVWLSQAILYSDMGMLLTPLLILAGTYWSPFQLFKANRQVFWTILGILTALWFPLLWLFPLCLIPICFLCNSIYFGTLSTLVLIHVPLFFGPDPFIHIPVAMGLFVLTFFLFSVPIFSHFEKKPITLLETYRKRP